MSLNPVLFQNIPQFFIFHRFPFLSVFEQIHSKTRKFALKLEKYWICHHFGFSGWFGVFLLKTTKNHEKNKFTKILFDFWEVKTPRVPSLASSQASYPQLAQPLQKDSNCAIIRWQEGLQRLIYMVKLRSSKHRAMNNYYWVQSSICYEVVAH